MGQCISCKNGERNEQTGNDEDMEKRPDCETESDGNKDGEEENSAHESGGNCEWTLCPVAVFGQVK